MQTAPRIPSLVMSSPFNIATSFVRLREVTDGIAGLDLGRKQLEYRCILKMNCVNFALMSENEQDAVIEGFKSFLNGLAFPIQIVIRNLPHNLESYLSAMESVEGDLAAVARDHAQFVRVLSSRRALIKREYYIIVPAEYEKASDPTEALITAQLKLELRIEELLQQLERMGLTGRLLTRAEIVSLYQSCFLFQDVQSTPITNAMLEGINKPMRSAVARTLLSGHFSPSLGEAGIVEQEAELSHLIQSLPVKQEQSQEQWWDPFLLFKTFMPKKLQQKTEEVYALPSFGQLLDIVTPSSIGVFPSYIRIDGELQTEYSRTLALVHYPRSAYPGWLDRIIQIDQPHVDFSIHINPHPPEVVSAHLGRKVTQLRGSVIVAQREGRSLDPTTKIALEDVEQLRDNLARGDERVFNINVFIRVRAQNYRTLTKNSNRISTKVRSMDFRALPTHWQHHLGLLSCLPDANNTLPRIRLFGTGAAGTFFPFTGSDISMDEGVMFGVQANGGLVIINPFNSKVLENANMVVFAKSGSGKSFFLKTVSCRLLSTCNVYVVDPEAEYQALCERVHGQYVRLSTDSLQINPFELYGTAQTTDVDEEVQAEEGNFFREKLLNLITLLELILSDYGTLPQMEKAFLYQCLIKTYENRGITMDATTHTRQPPNMQEFFVILSSNLRGDDRFGVGKDIYGLSQRLERYLHLFPARTHLALNNRYIDFNIRELNESLKPIGLFIITEFLWTKMRQARRSNIIKKNTIILIDEAWLLMQFPQGAKFLEEFARRIRKYGGGLWCTTQNSDDFLSSDQGKTILAMSTMKFLMKQDSSTIDSVVNTFNLSSKQKAFLLAARRGEGLFATRIWTQMQVLASPMEAEMANTTLISQAQAQQQKAFLEQDLQHLAEMNKQLEGPKQQLLLEESGQSKENHQGSVIHHHR
jgi:hypothetical protein